jgi:hypothetical protein
LTASPEVLAELRRSGLPVTDQAGLAALAEGEGGNSFRTLYSGGTMLAPNNPNVSVVGKIRQWNGSLDAFPDWGGATAAGGTHSTAAGAWQDTGTTWLDYAARFGVTDFQPQSQIKFNLALARQRFPQFSAVLTAGTPQVVSPMLVKTWPGGADSGFAKRYTNNLAALSGPPPDAQPATINLKITATDVKGNPVKVVLQSAAVALLMMGIPTAICSPRPEPVAVASVPSLADSTFFFVHGPSGLEVVQK